MTSLVNESKTIMLEEHKTKNNIEEFVDYVKTGAGTSSPIVIRDLITLERLACGFHNLCFKNPYTSLSSMSFTIKNFIKHLQKGFSKMKYNYNTFTTRGFHEIERLAACFSRGDPIVKAIGNVREHCDACLDDIKDGDLIIREIDGNRLHKTCHEAIEKGKDTMTSNVFVDRQLSIASEVVASKRRALFVLSRERKN